MPYVMVPVPEEHVEDVMNYLLKAMSRASLQAWDADAMTALFAELDEFGRTLLAFVGRSAANEKDLPEAEAAKLLQLSPRETIAVVREINDLCREMDRMSLISRRSVAEVQPNGRAIDVPVLAMEEEHVPLVNAAVEADRANSPTHGGD